MFKTYLLSNILAVFHVMAAIRNYLRFNNGHQTILKRKWRGQNEALPTGIFSLRYLTFQLVQGEALMEKYHINDLKSMKINLMGYVVSICGLAKKEQ